MMRRPKRLLTILAATFFAAVVFASSARPDDAQNVVVTVVAFDGTPIAGAKVELFEQPTDDCDASLFRGGDRLENWRLAVRRPPAVASRTTGADGVATLSGVRSGSWTFAASKPGRARGGVFLVPIGDDAATRTCTISLGRERTLSGRVRDSAGHALAGATVTAAPPSSEVDNRRGALIAETVCASDGSYRLEGLAADNVELWVAPPRAVAAPFDVVDLRTVDRFDIELSPVRPPISGTIVDAETGSPVTQALVRLRAWDKPRGDHLEQSAAAALTDEHGRYEIDGLRVSNIVQVSAERAGYAKYSVETDGDPFTLRPPDTVPEGPTIKLSPAGRIVGRVIGPDGPVADACVVGFAEDDGRGHLPADFIGARTGADGRYVIDRLPPGMAMIEVTALGLFAPESWGTRAAFASREPTPGTGSLMLSRGETTHDVVMAHREVLHGRLTDMERRPINGARVTSRNAVATSAQDGSFAIVADVWSRCAGLTVEKPGFVFGPLRCSNDADVSRIRFSPVAVAEASRVQGRIRRADGAPVHDARVAIVPCWEGNDSDDAPRTWLTVDAAGGYSGFVPWAPMNGARRRTFVVRACAADCAPAVSKPLTIEDAPTTFAADLLLDDGAVFAGRVVDDAGRGLESAIVSIVDRSGDRGRQPGPRFWGFEEPEQRVVALTSPTGDFRVPGLLRRGYRFHLRRSGSADVYVDWQAADPEVSKRSVTVRLEPTH